MCSSCSSHGLERHAVYDPPVRYFDPGARGHFPRMRAWLSYNTKRNCTPESRWVPLDEPQDLIPENPFLLDSEGQDRYLAALLGLDALERELFLGRMGYVWTPPKTYFELAEEYGMSPRRASWIATTAVKKIREALHVSIS